MSGRKQHYLPQFLQRPFSHRVVKHNYYVHVHEQRHHYSPSTTGIGAKRDFYSSTQDTRADDNITQAESSLVQIIEQIIQKKQLDNSSNTAMLFSLLSIRTLKMRNAMADLAATMLAVLREKSRKDGWTEQIVEKQINDRAWIDAQIDERLRSFGKIDRNNRAFLKAKLKPQIKKELELNRLKLLRDFNDLVQVAFFSLEAQAAEIADKAFATIFVESSLLEKRNALFEEFQFSLLESSSELFVLGDCAVASLDSEGNPRLALSNWSDDVVLKQVFLPVSPRILIYGTRDSTSTIPNDADINKLSVALSNRFFISFDESTPHIEELKPLICTAIAPIVSLEKVFNL